MQPLVIGKAKQPRCFRGIKHLPVQYEANQKAWMTGLLFESWVRHIDKKMAGQHRQIILLLDNCGAHPPDMQGLTNTRIAFLPPNTTSMLQPCDQGIIRNFKMIYRTRLMRKYLTAYDAGTALTINLKQAVDIISVAWNDVLPATISNCWHHSGIIKSDVSSPLDTPQPATQMWEQQSLFERMKEVLKIPLEMDFDSYADADNDVVTNAMLSDVEIVESILQAKEEEETDQVDEEVDPIVHIPHPKEVLESIQTLRLFLQCQDESKSLHRHLSDLDNIEKSVQHLYVDISQMGLARFGRASLAIGRIAWDYKTRPRGIDEEEDLRLTSEVNLRSARRLLNVCQKNGGVFVKVGQHISALDYLIPPEYTTTLRVLQKNVVRETSLDPLSIIQRELGRDVSEIFEEIDETPLGTGSLAQVHAARLKSGERVAVKVQHPEVGAHSVVDIATMEVLVRLVAWLFPSFQFVWLAEEMKKNLPLELNFINEGKNADIIREKFAHLTWLKIPRVHWELSTKKLLVMEFFDGGTVTDKSYLDSHRISRNEVSKLIGELYSQMIFLHGHVHCDPHPGNILVRREGNNLQIVLLDHGLYTTLTDQFRLNYCHLWMAILTRDIAGIKEYAHKLGVGDLYSLLAGILTQRTWKSITKGIDRCVQTWQENEEIRIEAQAYFYEIAAILNKVPRQMILLLKTNDLLRNLEHVLGTCTTSPSFSTMLRMCIYAVHQDRFRRCIGCLSALLRYLAVIISLLYMPSLHERCLLTWCPLKGDSTVYTCISIYLLYAEQMFALIL
ncbi:ADCK1, partial [Cordylochernes scorpioides]